MSQRSAIQQIFSNAYFKTFANDKGDLSVELENSSVGQFVSFILNEINPPQNLDAYETFKDALVRMTIAADQTVVYFPGIKYVAW